MSATTPSDPEPTQETTQPVVEQSKVEATPKNLLKRNFTMWYHNMNISSSFEGGLQQIATFNSVEDFWGVYQHLLKVDKMPSNSGYYLFEEGIKPMWEDENNKNGGKFTLKLKKGYANKFWEELAMGFIGDYLDQDKEVNGIVITKKHAFDAISIWNRNCNEPKIKSKIKKHIRAILKLGPKVQIKYGDFGECLRPNPQGTYHRNYNPTFQRTFKKQI